jgi:hypothetical protein
LDQYLTVINATRADGPLYPNQARKLVDALRVKSGIVVVMKTHGSACSAVLVNRTGRPIADVCNVQHWNSRSPEMLTYCGYRDVLLDSITRSGVTEEVVAEKYVN